MKKVFGCILCVLLFLVVLLGGLGLWFWHATKQVPKFYKELEISAESRQTAEKDSQMMEFKVKRLQETIIETKRSGKIWLFEFSQDELNHWLAIAIGEKRPGIIPHQLKNPRCNILSDRIQAGVTVNVPEYQGVVSLECVPSVPDPNVLEMEILSISAGTVKMSGKLFRSIIENGAKSASIPLEILDRNGKMVLRMRLRKGDLAFEKHSIQVNTLTFEEGKILVTGTIENESRK